MEGWPTRHVVVRRVLVRWSIPVYQAVLISPVVPVAEASLSLLCPVLPVSGLLEDKTKSPCGRGSIVVYKNRL